MWRYCIQESIFSYINFLKKVSGTDYKINFSPLYERFSSAHSMLDAFREVVSVGQWHVTYSDTPLVGFCLAAHTPKILTDVHTDVHELRNFEGRLLRAPYSSRKWWFVCEEKATNVSVSQFHHSSCALPCTKRNRAFPQLPFLAKTKRFLPGHTGCCCLLSAPCPETRQRLPAG